MNHRNQKLLNIILQSVAEVCAYSVDELIHATHRKRTFVDARHITAYLLLKHNINIVEVAKALHRDRTTILNSRRKYTELYATDAEFRRKSDEITRIVTEQWNDARKPVYASATADANLSIRRIYEPINSYATLPAYASPEEYISELETRKQVQEQRNAQELRRRVERDKTRLRNALSEDASFKLTYVPYVIIEVVWDYIDTIFDLAQILRLQETKRLTRVIRDIHRDYDRKRFKIINEGWRKGEIDNMITFEDELSDYFSRAFKCYRQALIDTFGEVNDDTIYLITSVYMCRTIIAALYRYCEKQEKNVASILSYPIASIVPEEIRKVNALVIEYAGDMKLPKQYDSKINELVEELAKFIGDIELNKTENE